MRIAFDLDGTLIPTVPRQFGAQTMPFPWRWFFRESLRDGTQRLMRDLHADGHEVWVYTTSLRSRFYLRMWFLAAGIPLAGVVNADVHADAVRSQPTQPSKFPPAFGIDLLVDDAAGVELEGKRYGFRVVKIEPGDAAWAAKVRQAVGCAVLTCAALIDTLSGVLCKRVPPGHVVMGILYDYHHG